MRGHPKIGSKRWYSPCEGLQIAATFGLLKSIRASTTANTCSVDLTGRTRMLLSPVRALLGLVVKLDRRNTTLLHFTLFAALQHGFYFTSPKIEVAILPEDITC